MKKSTPSLPASSRLKAPSASGKSSMIKEVGGMKGSTGTTKRIMTSAGKSKMPKKGSY